MKIITSVLIFCSLISCSSFKHVDQKPVCPEGYDCNTEIIKNKSIKILEDSIGEKYVQFVDNSDYHTIKYTYGYKGKPEIADDSYEESIFFQVPVGFKEMMVKNKNLRDVNLIISKACFCPDAGYEIINQGSLKMEKKNSIYYIDLVFDSKKSIKINSLQTSIEL